MGGQEDKAAGKAKELGGKLTGDKELEAEGKTQNVGGKVEKAAEDVADSIKGVGKAADGDDRS